MMITRNKELMFSAAFEQVLNKRITRYLLSVMTTVTTKPYVSYYYITCSLLGYCNRHESSSVKSVSFRLFHINETLWAISFCRSRNRTVCNY